MALNQCRVSPASMSEVEDALKEYRARVESSDLSPSSKSTYIDMADKFVRWLSGEFVPGCRKAACGRSVVAPGE